MSEYDARLADRVRTRGLLGADDAARLLLPVAESLASIHAVSGAHGAVSPTAIQVDSSGRAVLLGRTEVAPDPAYVPPDPSAGLRPHPASADVWALAAVLLFVTTGHTPHPGRPPGPDDVDPRDAGWLTPLVELALVVDPRDRPTMDEVVDYLRARVPAPERRRRPSGLLLTLVATALVLGVGLLGAALLFAGSGDDPPAAGDRTTGTPTDDAGEAAGEDPPVEPSEQEVTASELEQFARDYVATASSDPERGYLHLTEDYQRASPRYREVWAAIEDPEILTVVPDTEALSVSYTYRYSLPGGSRRTEDVTLRLVQRAGRLLIAGASAR